nr:acetamidase [Colletotrichum truncatum]KAF6788207.1 acetamidase [Colletotrichum truncatum]
MTAPWEEIVERKRRDINAAIPQQWRLPLPIPMAEDERNVTGSYIEQHLSSREVEITNTDAPELVQLLSTGQWTAVEVVAAFCHRAALAHQFTNCMHEIFFDGAISRAKELDVLMAQGRGPVGPLHGLPVSFKDQFHIPGVETSMGYAGWIGTFEGIRGTGQEKLAESELVREVRMLGGVAYLEAALEARQH